MLTLSSRRDIPFAVTLSCLVVGATVALAQLVKVPTADKSGAKDNPLLKRYEGSVIVSYQQQGFGELTLRFVVLAV